MTRLSKHATRALVVLALIGGVGLTLSGTFLAASSARVSATDRTRATIRLPIPLRKIAWERAYAPHNPTVRIGYASSLDVPAYRTIIRESPRRVAIELLGVKSGPTLGALSVRCLIVPLRYPLGYRLLVDGATGRPPGDYRHFRPYVFDFLRLKGPGCHHAPRIRRIS